MLECAITGHAYADPGDGICDEGEWISWDWINEQIEALQTTAKLPTQQDKPLSPVLTKLIAEAKNITQSMEKCRESLANLVSDMLRNSSEWFDTRDARKDLTGGLEISSSR